MDQQNIDVVIVGGGMVGATLACSLGKAGLSVALLEKSRPLSVWPAEEYDLRVSALTLASQQLFQSLNIWPLMQKRGVQSLQKMLIWDENGDAELAIDSADAGELEMGSVVENRVIVAALWEQLESLETVSLWVAEEIKCFNVSDEEVEIILSGDKKLKASLLVGADGANSLVRKLCGIDDYGWAYQQTALVATVRPEKPHQKTAWQRFMLQGPLALLPLKDSLISIVWSLKSEMVDEYLKMSPQAFCQALSEASCGKLGSFKLMGERGAYPLKMQFSTSYAQERVVLVGDAIHTIHPLAGQGVNLGLKDVASLSTLVIEAHTKKRDIASQQVLRRYERQRKGDNLLMMGIMDAFKRIFSNNQIALSTGRNLIMDGLNRSSLLKKKICQFAMGLNH